MRRAARPDERVQHTLLHANRGGSKTLPTNAPTERQVRTWGALHLEVRAPDRGRDSQLQLPPLCWAVLMLLVS